MAEHWLQSDWLSAASGLASIAGLALSVWVAFQVRRLKVSYVARIRLVEIQAACEQALSLASDLARLGAPGDFTKAALEISRARTHLEEAERYFPCGERGRLRKKNQKINTNAGSASEIMERYAECNQALIVVESLISEKNWG